MLPKRGLSFAVPPQKIDFSAKTLRHFRHWRFMSETEKLYFDVDATIKQSTKKGEAEHPLYSHKRKHNEYLIIAEQDTYKNHQAQFIKAIYKTLTSNNIDIIFFTYTTDPRILYSANNKKKYTLNQVFALYGGAVLLYFGYASLWFNTQNFKIYGWTKMLARWQHRFWFTLNSPDNWNLPEKTGNKIFPNILPFTIDALQNITLNITNNQQNTEFSIKYWAENLDYSLTDINTELPLNTIELFFDPLLRSWIAACAVYPEINWELTLELGKLLSTKERNLCSANEISQLLRLDWFRKGYIPPEIRFALMEKWANPLLIEKVNAHIARLMKKDIRFDILKKIPAFRLQLSIHQLIGEHDPDRRNEIAEQLKKEIEQSHTTDYVALQYINEAKLSPVFFVLPDDLLDKFEKILDKTLKRKTADNNNIFSNYTENIGKTSFDMVFVKGGTFKMGDEYGDLWEKSKPVHEVSVKDFYIGKYPVTQKLWEDVMGYNPSHFKGCDDCPVDNVSWNDAQKFIKKLNEKTGKKYRLPSEAEWEYAARGGNRSKGYKYSGSNNINRVAWYWENSEKKTHPAGTKLQNELGIYDMSGNVWEWCQDKWCIGYKGAPADGTARESGKSSLRVMRGGSWFNMDFNCRVAERYHFTADYFRNYIGFRIAHSL